MDKITQRNDEDFLLESDQEDENTENTRVASTSASASKRVKFEPGLVVKIEEDSNLEEEQEDEDMPGFEEGKCLQSVHVTDDATELLLCQLEDMYEQHRELIVRKDGFISTPLHALKELARKFEEPIHTEVLLVPDFDTKPLVIVEIFAGVFRGVGQSFHARLSKQMAALDMLVKMKECSPEDLQHVPYGIYPGWRIMPYVCPDLLDVCKKNGLKNPAYVTKTNYDLPNFPLYTVECKLGKKTIAVGHSDFPHIARKLAAFYSIHDITGLLCPQEYVAMGSSCLSYKDLVNRGFQPKISAAKRQWFLDGQNSGIPDQSRGVDLDELTKFKVDLEKEVKNSNTVKKKTQPKVNDEVIGQQLKLQKRLERFG